MSDSPLPLPDAPSSAPMTPPEVYTEAQTRDGLAKLKQELETPEKALHLMKSFDKHKVDTSEWERDPKLAIPSIEKFFPEGDDKKILLSALQGPESRAAFDAAKSTIMTIVERMGDRQKEIDVAKAAIGELNENSLNKVAKEGVSKVFRSVSRASMPEILLWGSAALFLLNHIFKKDDDSTILRPLAIGGIAAFAANSLIQHFSPSGKSGLDYIHGLGVKIAPAAQKQLPEQMQALADYANVNNPPELVAMGHLGHESMSHVYSFYKSSRGHGVINPQSLGLSEHQISGERLFQIVDTLVKRHDERKDKKGLRVGRDGDFERDFVKGKVPGMSGDQEHSYSFLETCMALYRDDATDALNYAFSPEKKRAFLEQMERDANRMFEGTAATPLMRDDQMSFYGIKFHTKLPRREQSGQPQYVYELGNRSLSVGLDDGEQVRREQVGKLKEMAKDYILDTVKEKNPSSPVLGPSASLEYNYSRNGWVFKNVMLKGARHNVTVKDRPDGKLVAVVNGRDVEEWSQEKLEEAA